VSRETILTALEPTSSPTIGLSAALNIVCQLHKIRKIYQRDLLKQNTTKKITATAVNGYDTKRICSQAISLSRLTKIINLEKCLIYISSAKTPDNVQFFTEKSYEGTKKVVI
jgi:hypothetical protein